MRAFEVNAVDYLLKPVEKTRLSEALNRAQERIEHAESSPSRRRVGAAMRRTRPCRRPIWSGFRYDGGKRSSSSRCTDRVHRRGRRTAQHHHEKNERHAITYRLKDLEQRLDPARFIRLGRGTLANSI